MARACARRGDGQKHPDDIAEAPAPDGRGRLCLTVFETTILAANFLSFPDMAQVAANQMERWLNIRATVQPGGARGQGMCGTRVATGS